MSIQGWNAGYPNAHHLGNEHSRPYGSSTPTLFACRICDKIFLSTHSLIEHYETHQDHLRTNYQSIQRERRERMFTNNSFLQQRHHPYFPNGFRTLQPRNPSVANTNPLLVSSQTHSLLQQQRNPGSNSNVFPVPSQNHFSIAGRNPVTNTKQFTIQKPSSILPPQVFPSAKKDSVPASQPELSFKTSEQKGLDESADKRTVWYISQLEQPKPNVIDLESHNKKHEDLNLDLKL